MDISLIYGGDATLEDFYELNEKKGVEFVVEDGKVSQVLE